MKLGILPEINQVGVAKAENHFMRSFKKSAADYRNSSVKRGAAKKKWLG